MHTKGQWFVAKINGGADNEEIGSEVNGCWVNIAEVFGACDYSNATVDGKNESHYKVSKEEAEANARLIAAAPELLAENGNMKILLALIVPELEARLSGFKKSYFGGNNEISSAISEHEEMIRSAKEFLRDFEIEP